MPLSSLVATASGCTGLTSVTTEDSFSMLSSTAVIECSSTTLSIGDPVSITIMGSGVFSGFTKRIERLFPERIVRVSCNNVLVRAVDFFIVADDPEAPFQRNNIGTLQLIKDLLALCGITSVSGHDAPFTWGTNSDGARFNLQSVSDAIQFIASIVGDTIYADGSGNVIVANRKPFPDGDTPAGAWTTGNSGNILSLNYSQSTDKTRNKVVVYGKTPLKATASASNPYLVVDQAICIAHELLDTDTLVTGTANLNLALLNRLERKAEVELTGDASVQARSVYTITESFSGLNENAFAYRVSHTLSESGYSVSATMTM